MIEAWQGAFPDLFTDEEPSEELQDHFRYPGGPLHDPVRGVPHVPRRGSVRLLRGEDEVGDRQHPRAATSVRRTTSAGEDVGDPVTPTYLLFKLPDETGAGVRPAATVHAVEPQQHDLDADRALRPGSLRRTHEPGVPSLGSGSGSDPGRQPDQPGRRGIADAHAAGPGGIRRQLRQAGDPSARGFVPLHPTALRDRRETSVSPSSRRSRSSTAKR